MIIVSRSGVRALAAKLDECNENAVSVEMKGVRSMFCATVLYPNKEGSAFDFEHYAGTLAPMYARFLGENCVKFEVRKGLVTPGRPVPHYICIASFWVKSREEFGTSLADPRMRGVMAKISSFTDIEPIRQFDEVVA